MRFPFRRRTPVALPDGWAWAGRPEAALSVRAGDLGAPVGPDAARRVVAELLAVHPAKVGPAADAVMEAGGAAADGDALRLALDPSEEAARPRFDRCVVLGRRPGRSGWEAVLAFDRKVSEDPSGGLSYAVSIGVVHVSGRSLPNRLGEALAHAAVRQIGLDADALRAFATAGSKIPSLDAVLGAAPSAASCAGIVGAVSDGFETVFAVDLDHPGPLRVATLSGRIAMPGRAAGSPERGAGVAGGRT